MANKGHHLGELNQIFFHNESFCMDSTVSLSSEDILRLDSRWIFTIGHPAKISGLFTVSMSFFAAPSGLTPQFRFNNAEKSVIRVG
jgi:hypothetical protein